MNRWLILWLLLCSRLNAQGNGNSISISPPIYGPEKIVIPFRIPNAGMVEFYLYDDITNKGIIRTQLICEKGDSMIVFKASRVEAGMPYRYDVVYKGQKISGKLRP